MWNEIWGDRLNVYFGSIEWWIWTGCEGMENDDGKNDGKDDDRNNLIDI